MIIAHLPAGYILGKSCKTKRVNMKYALLGSVFPDIDMLYYYLVSDKTTNHHEYLTHIPATYFLLAGLLLIPIFNQRVKSCLFWFLFGAFLHLILDTPVSGIAWGYPLDDTLIKLIDPSSYNIIYTPKEVYFYFFEGWVLNLANHWIFKIELAIVLLALFIKAFTLKNWSRNEKHV